MTNEHLRMVITAGIKDAAECAKDRGSEIQLLALLAYTTGIHQATALLMRWDGEVTPHQFNKVLREHLKSLGIEIVIPEKGDSSSQNFVPKSPPAN
jgi:hypothetical protein